ncbi:PhzF family phenazine biosynthesis protein, partial [Streptomyces sp. DT225]
MSDYDVPAGTDILRVFCDPDGRHGNALGVVRDGRRIPGRADRQELAGKLGFSETVFVDDPERGRLDIYTPGLRLPFAGHPVVG